MTLTIAIRRAFLGLSLLLTACGPGADEAPTRFTLRFAPPDGTELEQHLAVSRTQDVTGNPTITEQSDSVVRFRFEKTDAGYEVTGSQISSSTTRDGQAADNPISQLLGARPAIYVVDPEGHFVTIRGFEDIGERVSTDLPSEISGLLKNVLTEEVLVAQGRNEWTSRYGRFAGKSVEIGDIWGSQSRFDPIGRADLPRYSATRFETAQQCGDKLCLRLRILFDSDPDELRQEIRSLFGEDPEAVLADLEIEEPSPDAARLRIWGSIERVIDPDTLLPLDEKQLKVFTRTAGGTVLTVTESRLYQFVYPDGGA